MLSEHREKKRVKILLERSKRLNDSLEKGRVVSNQQIRELLNALSKGVERVQSEARKDLLRTRIKRWGGEILKRKAEDIEQLANSA